MNVPANRSLKDYQKLDAINQRTEIATNVRIDDGLTNGAEMMKEWIIINDHTMAVVFILVLDMCLAIQNAIMFLV